MTLESEKFLASLHEKGLKTTLNDHPRSGVHQHEEVYEEMAKFLEYDTSGGAPIHFDPASKKYMNAFLGFLYGKLEEQGINFWRIDW